MAKRTLTTVWQQADKLHGQFKNGKRATEDIHRDIEELFGKAEVQQIAGDLGRLLMEGYENFESTVLAFKTPMSTEYPTTFDNKDKILYIDPMRSLKFIDEIREIDLDDETFKESFQAYRKNSFLFEMGKLPSKFIFFLLILKQVAISDGLTHIGLHETPELQDDTSFYQTTTWAFNALEKKTYTLNGENLRTKYAITWHESSWINED